MKDIPAKDTPGAVALWQSLRDYLEVNVEVDPPGPPEATSDVTARFTVTNRAPNGVEWPNIVFMGVGVKLANLRKSTSNLPRWASGMKRYIPDPPSTQGHQEPPTIWLRTSGEKFPEITPDEGRHGDALFPGQTITYELSVPSEDIPYFEFGIEGTVSRRHLFHYEQSLPMPASYTKPPLISTLQAFNVIDIHSVLNSAVKSMPDLGPDTRLGDLQPLINVLSDGIEEVTVIQPALNDVYREAPNPNVGAHIRTAYEYLAQVRSTFEHMKEAISSANYEEIAAAAQGISALEEAAAQINRATEELMSRYEITDAEANYRYREG